MSDALDRLIALNAAYGWLNGARRVAEATGVATEHAATIAAMARGGRAGRGEASPGGRVAQVARDLEALDRHWADQAADVQDAAAAAWPAIPGDAPARHAARMALEAAEGTGGPADPLGLGETVRSIESCRGKVVERASYCAMVAEQAREMEAAYLAASDAIAARLRPIDTSPAPARGGIAQVAALARGLCGRARAVAAAYGALAEAAGAQGDRQRRDQAQIDAALDGLYRMQGEAFLRDADEMLKGLFKAA